MARSGHNSPHAWEPAWLSMGDFPIDSTEQPTGSENEAPEIPLGELKVDVVVVEADSAADLESKMEDELRGVDPEDILSVSTAAAVIPYGGGRSGALTLTATMVIRRPVAEDPSPFTGGVSEEVSEP